MLYKTIVFLPLLGALIAGGFGGRMSARMSEVITSFFMVSAALLSCLALYNVGFGHQAQTIHVLTFIDSGQLTVDWTLRIDTMTAVMLVVVNGVSSLVHVYSIGYMHEDPHRPRFFAYLSLFTFAMLMLVTSDNFVQMFFGWEGVGLCSYLLIGFWYKKPSANAAAIKAFVVNRVGDFGFVLGIAAVFMLFGTLNFTEVFERAPEMAGHQLSFLNWQFDALTLVCLLLFMGAMGKSAQFMLHTWLPDAMEGPTPVSALIHAATMVTAGVFMVARMSPLFEYSEAALMVVTIVGGSTAIFAATIACTQNDIKRVIAYSTCSQLGYMFFALGVSAYSAGIFHLMTHGFFKALLFLGAGSVIHAMSDEQDMRKMGGIWKHIKVTYVMMWIGSLALVGIFPFAGFYSKDIILEAAWGAHTLVGNYAFWLGITAAFLTAFYSWRLLIMTFHGTSRANETVLAHVHESPKVMLVPLIVLALGAMFAGYVGYESFVGGKAADFWGASILILEHHTALETAHHAPFWVKYLPLFVGFAGIALAYLFYMFAPGLPALLVSRIRPVYQFVYNKWYIDELYDVLFVRPAFYLGRNLWKTGDGSLIDGVGPNALAAVTLNIARRASRLQTGYLYHYTLAMMVGVVALISMYILVGG